MSRHEHKQANIHKSSAEIVRINAENAAFTMKNGFLSMTFTQSGEKQEHDRVFLHRTFPFELLWEYISVLDGDSVEIGLIFNLSDFDDETRALLETELERKYYQPKIKTIEALKERYGFSYWTVVDSEGRRINFTMQDTFRNIIRIGEDKAVLLDVDGNRFVIDSILGLDKKSYRKIELYL